MPIYEYYCPACDGCFSHLAQHYDEPPPPCPGCGSRQVEKLVSRVHLGRSDVQRRNDYKVRSQDVDQGDPGEMARFLQQAGSVAEAMAPVEQDVFREIVARRAEGAGDKDLQDVVDAIPFPRQTFARPHDHEHEHCRDEDHDHDPPKKRSPRRAKDLGWA